MTAVPVQFGFPGAIEIIVLLLILAFLAVPVVLVVALVKYLTGPGEREERIEELEREVARLREDRETAARSDDDPE